MDSGTPREREGRATRRRARQRGLTALARRAEAALVFERIWPPLAWAGALVALFLAASWFGLWSGVPRLGRVAGVAVFAALLVRRAGAARRAAAADARGDARPPRPRRRTPRIGRPLLWPIGSPPPATMRRPTRCGFSTDAGSPSKSQRIAPAPPAPRMAWRDPRALRFGALHPCARRGDRRRTRALCARRRGVRLARRLGRGRRRAHRRLGRSARLHRQAADPARRLSAPRPGAKDRRAGGLDSRRARRRQRDRGPRRGRLEAARGR